MLNGNPLLSLKTNKNQSITEQLNETNVKMPQAVRQTGYPMTAPNQRSPLGPVMSDGNQFGYQTEMMSGAGPMSTYANPTLANEDNVGQQGQQNQMSYGDALKQVAPNLGLGALQTAVGLGGLLTQGDIPSYEEPQRLQQAYQDYAQIAEQGFPEVNAAAQQRMARQINTGRQEAMDAAGPSTANAITAATTSQNLEGQRQIAEMEADQRLKGLQQQAQIAQTLRQIQDRRTRAQRQRYGQEEAAFGKAAQSGLHNVTNALNLGTGVLNAATGGIGGTALQTAANLFGGNNSQ